jgi:hypothetical protein
MAWTPEQKRQYAREYYQRLRYGEGDGLDRLEKYRKNYRQRKKLKAAGKVLPPRGTELAEQAATKPRFIKLPHVTWDMLPDSVPEYTQPQVVAIMDAVSFISLVDSSRSILLKVHSSDIELLCRLMKTLRVGYIVANRNSGSNYIFNVTRATEIVEVLEYIIPSLTLQKVKAQKALDFINKYSSVLNRVYVVGDAIQVRNAAWIALKELVTPSANKNLAPVYAEVLTVLKGNANG